MSDSVKNNLELIESFMAAFKCSRYSDMSDCIDKNVSYRCHILQVDSSNDFFNFLKTLDNNYSITISSIGYNEDLSVFNVNLKYSYVSLINNSYLDLKAYATITIKNSKITKINIVYDDNDVAEKIYNALLLEPPE